MKIFSQLQFFRARSSGREWHRSDAVGEFFLATTYTLFRQMDEPEHDSAAARWSGTDRNDWFSLGPWLIEPLRRKRRICDLTLQQGIISGLFRAMRRPIDRWIKKQRLLGQSIPNPGKIFAPTVDKRQEQAVERCTLRPRGESV
jgi:hypothetical protein